uniref:Uncharacterized protein n=1 Tax=Vespula pensylvanica TaxID=30213 RepID=A0A834NC45_VESPE|nr:hypothetical protein H0235_015354 [Vespula pensylvanica]
MSEADGVESGAICKRGFTHLQFAEKPEAPEAERHLGRVEGFLFSRSGKIEGTLAYVGWHRRWCSRRARLSSKLTLMHSTYSRECFRNARVSIVTAIDSILGSGVCRDSTTGRAQVVIEASDSVGLHMQQPPRGGTWVGVLVFRQYLMGGACKGQDAHRVRNQQTFRSNKRKIIFFIIQGQDAHRASINEDFKTSLQPCEKQ